MEQNRHTFIVKVNCVMELEAMDEQDALGQFYDSIDMLDGGVDEWFNTHVEVEDFSECCKNRPLFTNKQHGGYCERDFTECNRCLELQKKGYTRETYRGI